MNAESLTSLLIKPVLYILSYLVPKDEDIWTFTTDASGRFAENTKYLFLFVNETDDETVPIWISKDAETVARLRANGYEAYSPESWRGRYYVLRSKFLFTSHRGDLQFWEFTAGVNVIQLWHGNPFKRVGNDLESETSLTVRLFERFVGKQWEEFAVTKTGLPFLPFSTAHDVPSERAMETGYPRNDVLFDSMDGERIGPNHETYERIESLSEKSTIIAYFPTFREAFGYEDGQSIDETWLGLEDLNDILEEEDGHLLMKFHPHSTIDFDAEKFDRIYLLPSEFDLYPALKYVDALVTDYSSIFFDYLLLDNPVLFYPRDLEEYELKRGFYFDYETITPGPKAYSTEELHDHLEQLLRGRDKYATERAYIRNLFYEYDDGRSSERVYDHVQEEYLRNG